MLKLIPRRWSNQANPIAARWNHFSRSLDSIPATIALIQAVPEDKFKDVAFLEEKLIPALGLNDENLEEQPKELAQFFGSGLHIFQYPNQLARYMAWLAEYATETRSYVEIGTRWGGTLIVICEWLRRIGTPLSSVTAIDPIGETPLLEAYGNHLSQQAIQYRFLSDSSASQAVADWFLNLRPDFVFIDGDHSMKGALADHMLARKSAQIIVHHDIASDSCPETTLLWQALKELEAGTFTSTEFIDQYKSVNGSFLGIGALKKI